MWNATIKGLLSHKLRLALTALAIVLGVSFVSGTYVLTDTMNATFSQLFKDTTKGIDVVVQTRQTFASDQGDTRDPVPASLLQQIKSVDGVKVAEGSVNGFAQFIGKNGKAVTTGGAPTLGVSASEAPELNSNFTMRSGRIPAGPNEVAVDGRTASKQGFKVGDQVKVLSQGPTRTYTVSGIVGFGQADNLAGATLAVFDLKTAQQVLGSEGKFNEIDVVAQPRGHPGAAPRSRRRGGPRQVREHHRRRPGAALRQGDPGRSRFLLDRAAGVRRGGAVRRGLPDLQHLLDHRGAADP